MSADRAEHILNAIRGLPRGERLRLVERVVHELAEVEPCAASTPIGLFADEPELLERVAEDAMASRERDALREG
jgi:hypothetical protein